MIKAGNQIEQEQGKTIDAETDDLAGIPIHGGKSDKHCTAGKCENRANEMTDTVESLPL